MAMSVEELTDEKWMDSALCKGEDVAIFFEEFEGGSQATRRTTLNMCQLMCPVRGLCYNYAKETRSTGVFGGEYFWIGKPIKNAIRFKSKYDD